MTGTTDRDDPGEVLVALTLHRATRMNRIYAPVPKTIPGLAKGFTIVSVSLDGMASLPNPGSCDQCGRLLARDTPVLGKIVSQTDYSITGTFFSPTCYGCFYEDRGGYYSTAVAALVMET